MSQLFRVSATALRMRASPGLGGAIVATLPRGAMVTATAAAADADGWLAVASGGLQGFVKASFLEAAGVGAPPAPVPAAPTADVNAKNRDLTLLHPEFRKRAEAVLARLAAEGVPFRIFEAYRSPERQTHLFAQGRTRPGSIVTKAAAWSSHHQYGVAADFVLFDPTWTWDDSGPRRGHWRRLHEIAKDEKLRPLSFEMPHLELEVSIQDLRRGLYPGGGDEGWADNLSGAIRRWASASPAAPPSFDERPPLVA